MKRTLIALAMSLASTAAFANTGNINFHGTITPGGTCPIEVVEPGTGGGLPRVVIGSYHPSFFDKVGKQTRPIPFALRLSPGTCTIAAGEQGYVTFSAIYGPEGTDLYALRPGGTSGLALAIQDKSLTNLAPDKESVAYLLDVAKPTDMLFYAMYQSTAATVTEGDAASEVTFLVDIK
ncbi:MULTISPECIES: fimbrial protein [Pseudomonas]|uniref:fimbrial protein n=1 Tax=Pseudomonas TaxID=286 RepID=UPI0028DD85E5|nr:fimbrial protein [Pseudomonas taiwanensis]MDT8921973.1 fimbrial protein [Pseudomonas taiwanensis]